MITKEQLPYTNSSTYRLHNWVYLRYVFSQYRGQQEKIVWIPLYQVSGGSNIAPETSEYLERRYLKDVLKIKQQNEVKQ